MNKRWLAPAGLVAAALIAAGCGSSGGSGGNNGSTGNAGNQPGSGQSTSAAPVASGNTVRSSNIGGAMVLTNAQGFALYWFVPDTSTASKCNGSCATFWPPVNGPVTAGSGVKGTFGTITRDDGSLQATFDGHPLYTYKGDTSPGEATGDGVNAAGGLWHEVTASGAAPANPSTSPSMGSGGGGDGY
jgi:predicted lipoprotein with Yx(FWY)xxD motif